MEIVDSLKLLIVGLDGASFKIADPLIRQGGMPNLAGLINRGVRCALGSTIPPVSSTAWGAVMTGLGAGGSGVFGFKRSAISEYGFSVGGMWDSSVFRGRAFWDLLGAQGSKAVVVGVPMTFPPWPVNGVMVSGFPAPADPSHCVEPPSAAAWIDGPISLEMGFRNFNDRARILSANREIADRMLGVTLRALEEIRPETAIVVFSDIDKIQHEFAMFRQPAVVKPPKKYADLFSGAIDDFYREADKRLGILLGHVSGSCRVLVLSDHGGGAMADKYAHLNAWLGMNDWLYTARGTGTISLSQKIRNTLKAALPRRYVLWVRDRFRFKNLARAAWNAAGKIDWTRTSAYWVRMQAPSAGIAINLRGRQPLGIVAPGPDYEMLRDRIIERLLNLTDPATGNKVVREAHKRENVFTGPYVPEAPDIVLTLETDYRPGHYLNPPAITGIPPALLKSTVPAEHSMDGLFAAAGPGFLTGVDLPESSILNIAPTIYYLAGFPVPKNLEGFVPENMFEPGFLRSNPIRFGPPLPLGPVAESSGVSPEEQKDMLRQLERLGYL